MTPDELQQALDEIGWTPRRLGTVLQLHYTTPQRWASGRYTVPDAVAHWLLDLVQCHRDHPPPLGDWGRPAD